MASVLQIASPDAIRRIQRVQTVTIAWMSVEAVVSLFAAWRARSPALLAFGGDSANELFSAVVVLWRFRASSAHEHVERRAAHVAGALLFALACGPQKSRMAVFQINVTLLHPEDLETGLRFLGEGFSETTAQSTGLTIELPYSFGIAKQKGRAAARPSALRRRPRRTTRRQGP